MKQNKKAKICFVIYIAGFFFKKKFCYEVIVKQKNYKRSSNYYLDMSEAGSTHDARAFGMCALWEAIQLGYIAHCTLGSIS